SLMCTHVLDTAEKIGDRFYMMETGSLFLQGTLKDIQGQTRLEGQSLLVCFYKAVQGDQPGPGVRSLFEGCLTITGI
ncbi:hypothetical protein MMJ17_26600, partial [Bacillus spizizenii]|nr:hypothetical protein [Bacillus spizizenii]